MPKVGHRPPADRQFFVTDRRYTGKAGEMSPTRQNFVARETLHKRRSALSHPVRVAAKRIPTQCFFGER